MESWQDRLAALRGTLDPDTEDQPAQETAPEQARNVQSEALNIVYERKGRAGKQATIIEGFTIPDHEVAQLASKLKSSLGTGGSARGGEILIQGDRRDDVRKFLKANGYKVKG